jgi:4-hydroxybenzoate polyprenyltransferase
MKQENKDSFRRFWKVNGTNHLIALVVTLIMCGFVGSQLSARHYFITTPAWLLIGLVFWCLRLLLIYRAWKRDDDSQNK